LLEKIRVVKQNRDERNYHVFYQLLAGASAPLLGELGLNSSPLSHVYLNQSGCVSIPGVSDSEDFKVLNAAMTKLQFSADATTNVFQSLAAILHLGNLAFRQTGDRASVVEQVVKLYEFTTIS
jgi:myosin heavy subunit